MPAEPREAADDVLREALVHLEVLAVVDNELDHALDVVRLGGVVRNQRVQLRLLAVGRVRRGHERRRVEVVLRQERH